MKIKLDENLPSELVDVLSVMGHDVHTVPIENLIGQNDDAVFAAAVDENRLFITQDLDFSDLRKFKPETHPGLILIRLRDPSRQYLIQRFHQALFSEKIETWIGCFVVISDRKIRVRRS